MDPVGLVLGNLYLFIELVNLVLILTMVFAERGSNPQAVLLWILVLAVIPLLGFVLYLLFGQTFYARHTFRRKDEDDALAAASAPLEQAGLERAAAAGAPPAELALARTLQASGALLYDDDNDVRYLADGDDFFRSLFDLVKEAKEYVFLEYYIVNDDGQGRALLDLLTAKAREGVEVRLLTDAVGSKRSPSRGIGALRQAGGHYATFHRLATVLLSPKKNNRNHRKIAIADGRRALVSGYNISDKYVGKSKLGHWRDAAVALDGGSVNALLVVFLTDWRYAAKEDLLSEGYFRDVPGPGTTPVQITVGGPDRPDDNSIHAQYLGIIAASMRQVYLTTPYFVPSEALVCALRLKAQSGADVRVIIPDKPDQPLVFWANRYYASRLLDAGVKVYEYHHGFIHAKTMVGDGRYCAVGSANLDMRSLNLNFECNAMVYSEKMGADMVAAFAQDLAESTEYTAGQYAARTLWQRFETFLARLAAGLL